MIFPLCGVPSSLCTDEVDQGSHVNQDEVTEVLNRDEGVYTLSHMYNQLLQQRALHSTGENSHVSYKWLDQRISEEVLCWEKKMSKM